MMVKTRPADRNKNVQTAFDNTAARFGKSLTHAKLTITKDENGHITGSTSANTIFTGVIIDNGRKIRQYLQAGQIDVGDALLYVSSTEADYSNIALEDRVFDGDTGDGTVDAWEVADLLDSPNPGGQTVFSEWRLKRIHEVTI